MVSQSDLGPTPYELIAFPKKPPTQQQLPGHLKYRSDRLHGTLFLTLQVQTSLHISTGVVVMGSDIDEDTIPLIKTMVQGEDKLLIQGSSLKGCIRSIYEAITNSRLGVIDKNYYNNYPSERLPCRQQNELCPASLVFGASGEKWGWQGLVNFRDAKCEKTGFTTGFMPILWSPKPKEKRAYFVGGKTAGRKFYYHMSRAIDKGKKNGIPVQQAAKAYKFTTQIQFMNLKPEELGTLFIVLGQDPNYPIALKLGGGKPIGMGTMTVQVTKADILQNKQDIRDRYSTYNPSVVPSLVNIELQNFMQAQILVAHNNLIEETQLKALYAVLGYGKTPITRPPYEQY